MTLAADIQFRRTDTDATRVAKLEVLREAVGTGGRTRTLYASIANGLPNADASHPLMRFDLTDTWQLGLAIGNARSPALNPASFRVFKNGAANGTIRFVGSVATDMIVDKNYLPGSIFEIFPPLVADPVLDDVAISIPVSVS